MKSRCPAAEYFVRLVFSLMLLASLSILVAYSLDKPRPATVESQTTHKIRTYPRDVKRAKDAYGQLPLSFTENRGQLNSQVAYYVQGSDTSVYFGAEGITFTLTGEDQHHAPAESFLDRPRFQPASLTYVPDHDVSSHRWALKLDFISSNPHAKLLGQDETNTLVSYFKGSRYQWRTGLRTYSSIIYSDLWSGIDLVYSGTVNRLKYQFLVRPGADPSQIKLAYRGASAITINADGQLDVSTPLGSFHDDRPYAFQDAGTGKIEIGAEYSLSAEESDLGNVYSFTLGDYDRTKPLVIDPAVLIYSGLIGGPGDDTGSSISIDDEGNLYIAGTTSSVANSFPVKAGRTVNSKHGSSDIFVAKINAEGTSFAYASYIGGTGENLGSGITVDSKGAVYVTGQTTATDFPIINGSQGRSGGRADAIVAKLNSTGSDLLYSTYLGGSGADEIHGIALDAKGFVYITGSTQGNLRATEGAFRSYYAGGASDAFVAKLNPSFGGQDSFKYLTYLGGGGDDHSFGIAVDSDGAAYITGQTSSLDFPLIHSAQSSLNGAVNAFVAKLGSTGSMLDYSTLLGGSGSDIGRAIAVDKNGAAYVTGVTTSEDFPTLAPWRGALFGASDAFVTKVNEAGSSFVYSTYLGGVGNEDGRGIALNSSGNAYVTGWTSSYDFPLTNPWQTTYGGGEHDVFVVQLNDSGSFPVYSTLFGGGGDDRGNAIAADESGNAYVTGATSSSDFPTINSFESAFQGATDAFVAKFEAKTVTESAEVMALTCTGTKNWIAGSGTWQTAVNWSGGTLPGPADDVCIPAGVTVTLSSGTHSINNLGSSGDLVFSGGSLTVAGSFNSDGAVTLSATNLTLNATSSINGSFTQSGGTLGGTGSLTVAGLMTWSGGTMTGTGVTTAGGGINFTGTAGRALTGGRVLNNSGTAIWSSTGTFVINTSGVFNNLAGSVFDTQSDARIDSDASATLNNAGIFRKSAGTGSKTVESRFNNTGTVEVLSGTLLFSGGGTHTGPFTGAAGSNLSFGGGTHNLNTGADVTGANVSFSVGTTNIAGIYDVSNSTSATTGTVNFTSTSTIKNFGLTLSVLNTGNALTVNVATRPEQAPLTLNVGRTLNFNFTGDITIQTVNLSGTLSGPTTMNISGPLNWSAGTLTGNGTTNAQGGIAISTTAGKTLGGGRILNNSGTASWTGTSGFSLTGAAVFNNLAGALLNAQDGLIDGTSSESVNNAGTFRKSAGSGSLFVDSRFNNSGTVEVLSGTLGFSGGGTSSGPFTGSAGTTFEFTGGTHNLNAGADFTSFNTTIRTGTVNIASTYNASNTTTLVAHSSGATGVANFNGAITSLGSTLSVSAGTANINSNPTTAPASLDLSGGTVNLNFSGTMTVGTSTISGGTRTGPAILNILNLLTWTSGTITGPSTTNPQGGMTISSNANKTLSGGHTLNNSVSAVWTGTGGITMLGGAIFNNLLDATFEARNDSQINASANETFNNVGTFKKSSGTGFTAIESRLINTGTVELTSGTLSFSGGGTSTGSFTGSTGTTFDFSGGTHNLNAGANLTGDNLTVRSGIVNIASTCNISSTTTLSALPSGSSGTVNFNGPITSLGNTLVITGGTANINSNPISAPGTLTLGGVNASAVLNLNFSGTMTVNTASIGLGGGRIGPGTLNISGLLTWSGGTMSGNGVTNANGGLNITTTANKTLSGHTLTNGATATWSGSSGLTMSAGAIFDNSGTFEVQTNTQINASALEKFKNSGTFRRVGAGSTVIQSSFINTGSVEVLSGILQFSRGCTQSAGATILSGGSIVSSALFDIQGGSLSGSGTLTGNVLNAGVASPGSTTPAPTGIINIIGNYTQTAVASLDVDIGGTNAGTQFDQLNVTGTATLNGALIVTTLTGYVPNGGDAFKVVSYASRSGSYATINYLNTPSYRSYQHSYNVNDLTLLTQAIPVADLSITKTDLPDPVPVGSNLTYTIVVSNSGPDPATGVNVTDTLPSGVAFISSFPSQGACSGTSTVGCNLGTINNQSSATITIVVSPTIAVAGTTITNAASVNAAEVDSNTANNTASVSTAVIASADISIMMADAPDPVLAGDAVTYTLTVTNTGPSEATGVTLTNALPAGTTFVSASTGCSASTGSITCNLNTIGAGSSVVATLVLRTSGSGIITNTAIVTSATFDPNTNNNTAAQNATINPKADLSITKSGSPNGVLVGQNLTYGISVTNIGPSAATDVVVTDMLPAGVTVSSFSSGCSQSANTITCGLGTVTVNQVKTVTVVVTPTLAGLLNNTASVSSNVFDPESTNNSATETTTVNAFTDLGITLTDLPDPVLVGDSLTFIAEVNNGGPTDATGVTVTDHLPSTVTFVSASSTVGSCSHATGTVTCTVGTLANAASASVTIVVTPKAQAVGTLSNSISIDGAETDPIPTNNSASTVTVVNPKTDLRITKSDLPDPVYAGSPLTYEIVATNVGPSAATGVIVSDQLAATVTFDVASFTVGGNGGSCAYNNGANSITCNVGNLASNQSANVTIVVIPQASAVPSVTNTANVTGNQTDPDIENNSATVETTVRPKANLSITKSDSPDPATVFGQITYTIAVSNSGPSPATAVTVADQLPSNVSFVSASSGCDYSSSVVTCSLGSLNSGATAIATIVVTPLAGGTISNTASVTAAEFDPELTNNSTTQSTIINAAADLAITNIASPLSVVTGANVTYTITVTNNGPGAAASILVTDNLPPSLSFLSCSSTIGACGGTGNNTTVSIGSLASGASTIVTLIARVNDSVCGNTDIGSIATVASVTPDPNVGNNSASAHVLVSNPAPQATITGPSTGSIYSINAPVTFSGVFTDIGGGGHTATWRFDDDIRPGTVTEATNSISDTFMFEAPGVYQVTLSVTDNCGGVGTVNTIDELTAMIVIYDPDGGWVTGGGWFNSPIGAYVPNPTVTGKANFGFVSKYQHGATVPTGQTEFQFKAGNLNFHSTSYDWLVVAGKKAQYKGVGTINGSGSYRFMLTVIDGQQPGGDGLDKFRIRIWSDHGGLVYDNQLDASDSDDPTSVLGGGSIVIHK